MKFVILAPFGVRTGGPEACHQLSDMLLRNGFDAEMWLINDGDLGALSDWIKQGVGLANFMLQVPPRENVVAEYAHYQTRPFTGAAPGDDIVFILPEIYIWLLPVFSSAQVLIWWLSVDNAFKPLADINLNYLRMPFVRHAVQSAYAKAFVSALGLESTSLTDYTVVPDGAPLCCTERPLKVALNAGRKVIFNLGGLSEAIEAHCPGAEIVRIFGMTRDEVYQTMATSRLFIDIGNLPGKDRMAREALLLGANIIVGGAGSGTFAEDFPIPEIYRPKPHNLACVAALAGHMLKNPEVHSPQFKAAHAIVAAEKDSFAKEVLLTFSQYFGK